MYLHINRNLYNLATTAIFPHFHPLQIIRIFLQSGTKCPGSRKKCLAIPKLTEIALIWPFNIFFIPFYTLISIFRIRLALTANTENTMNRLLFLFPAFLLFASSCERKMSSGQIKDNLEKAMSAYLQKPRPGKPPLNFQMLDVDYYLDGDNFYLCNFKVKLYRSDGSDTTGFIRSKISNDFSVVKR